MPVHIVEHSFTSTIFWISLHKSQSQFHVVNYLLLVLLLVLLSVLIHEISAAC